MSGNASTAIKHYWFGKAYKDVIATIKDAHHSNVDSAKKYWKKIEEVETEYVILCFKFVFFGSVGLSIIVFGTLVWVVLVSIHVVIVSLIAGLIMLCFLSISLLERCYLLLKRWTTVCKYCGDRVVLPHFQCPSCRVWHTELRPSSYGILEHVCKCGEKLPCSFISKRHTLVARCPHHSCREEFNASIESRSLTTVIPIIGSPASGKTGLMIAIMDIMLNEVSPRFLMKGRFTDKMSESLFEVGKRHIETTGGTKKTTDDKPPAFTVLFESSDGKRKQQFYLFDAAGEVFADSNKLAAHHQYKHFTAGIFVIDPFALPVINKRYGASLAKHGLGVATSSEEVFKTLERLVIGMERHFGLKSNKLISNPFAVVVTKTDLAGLKDVLLPIKGRSAEDNSEHIRSKIQEWGGGTLVHMLDKRFSNVCYFAAAPIKVKKGTNGLSGELIGRGLEDVMLWLLESAKDPFVKKS